MNKRALEGRLARRCQVEPEVVREVLDAALREIIELVAEGKRVSLQEFGSFSSRWSPPTNRKNPHTGASYKVPAKMRVVFRPHDSFKEAIQVQHVEE
jgi:nucleoid DNA-binding protein